jgi:hypothetical protein
MKKRAGRPLGAAILLIGCCVPIAYYFFYSFGNLPLVLRCLGVVVVTAILFVGAWLLEGYVHYLHYIAKWVGVISSIAGMIIVGMRADVFPGPGTVLLVQPGMLAKSIQGSLDPAWGKSLQIYKLDLREISGRSLTATFPVAVSRIKVNLAGAPGSWRSLPPDGGVTLIPNPADGADIQSGHLSTGELAQDRWHVHSVRMAGKTIRWSVDVAGKMPDRNPTIWVAIQVKGWTGTVFAIGKILLTGLAIWVIAAAALLAFATRRSTVRLNRGIFQIFVRHNWTWSIPLLAFIAILGTLVYWSSSRTHYIFFWDYRNYWARTETVFEIMASGNWSQVLDSFISNYSANYSMLPTIIPALLCFVIGYPGRVDYAFLITIVYAIPAYLLVAYCGRQLVRPVKNVDAGSWVWASFAILFALPLSLGVVFLMMPDIGGVAITAAALLIANRLLQNLREDTVRALSPNSVAAALGLGLTLALMFLFRRWYVFASIGIGMAVVALMSIDWWRSRAVKGALTRRVSSLALVAFAALLLVVPVIVDWAANLGAHDYSSLYASYKWGAWLDFYHFRAALGLAIPLVVIIFIFAGPRLGLDRQFLGLLTISTLVAVLSFLHVQSPGLHHYYLLMPLLGAGVAAGFQYLWARWGASAAAASLLGLAVLGAGATMAKPPSVMRNIFPGYQAWLPKIQPGFDGMTHLTQWLVSPGVRDRSFCLIASSGNLNESSLFESWQIVPSVPRYPFSGRMISQAQVDSVNGAPFESIRNCEIALVATPLQVHLRDGQQDNVKILWQEIRGDYGIGTHFKKMSTEFDFDDGIVVVPYLRVTDITPADYQALVTRYKAMKAAEAAQQS